MRKFTLLLLVLFITTIAKAQTDNLSEVLSRLQQLEETVKQQSLQIDKLTSDVNEVTKQNLALKQNLNLLPTIATAKAGDVMEYRVLEVTGDPDSKEVHLVISANVIGDSDKRISYFDAEIMDELGNGYDKRANRSMEVNGSRDDLFHNYLDHHPNAPYTIDLRIHNYAPNAQYVKYLSLDVVDNTKHHNAVFQNLPIKWIAE